MTKFEEIITKFCSMDIDEMTYEDEDLKLQLKRKAKKTVPKHDPKEINDENLKDISNGEIIGKNSVVVVAPTDGICTYTGSVKKLKQNVKVQKGEVLCNIEIMKSFVEVTSPVEGFINRIIVEESSIVKKNDTLFEIREK